MKQIIDNLYVGTLQDFSVVKNNPQYFTVQACKYPCHNEEVGNVAKNHPEYLIAYRNNRMILNMVDSTDASKFNRSQFVQSVNVINEKIENGYNVLVHCNQGISRSPSIVLLYLAAKGLVKNNSYYTAKKDFLSLYPHFSPTRNGIEAFLIRTWWSYFV